jgi:hypothetical protein
MYMYENIMMRRIKILPKKAGRGVWGCPSVVEQLPNKHEALGSITSILHTHTHTHTYTISKKK